jgi:hypothetical protein
MRGGPGRVAIASALAIAFALALTTAASATGQWTIVQGAVGTSSGISGILYSTACAGTTCWAVGASPASTTAPNPPLIETNTGTGWSVVTAPSPAPVNTLLGVACVDANDCWAVGHTGDETLIEEYAAGTWSYVSSPNPPSLFQPMLTGVSCVSLDDCWAVGWGQLSVGYQTLIEHYDGSAWTIVASPNGVDADSNLLNGVACVSTNECWAVGGAQSTSPLVEQYTGSAWVLDTTLPTSGPASELLGVTCVSSTGCWAVGTHDTTDDQETQSLIEHFDGTAWEPVSSPNPIGGPNGENYLYGVTCDTGNECWAVGHSDYYLGADYGWSLIERYTASTGWTTDGPDPALSGENLYGVACGALECTAVGGNDVDIEPVIAQSPVTTASVGGGGSQGTSGAPPSGTKASTGSAGPGVPDTGGAGTPWAALLIAGGVVSVALARRLRSMSTAAKT